MFKKVPFPRSGESAQRILSFLDDEEDGDDVVHQGDEMHESSGDSGSDGEYVVKRDDEDGESEVEDEDIELEDDECDTLIDERKKTKGRGGGGGKKEKKGVAGRNEIREIRSLLPDDDSDGEVPHNKAQRSKNKGKAKANKGSDGLRQNWNRDEVLFPPAPKQRSRASSMASSHYSEPPLTDHFDDDDDIVQQGGGLAADEDDAIARQGLKSTLKIESVTKIEKLENTTKIYKKASTKSSKDRPKVADLPEDAKLRWNFMKIRCVDAIGKELPWADLSDAAITELWNGMFDENEEQTVLISSTPYLGKRKATRDEVELFQLIKPLVRNQVLAAEWKTQFALAAIKAVHAEWDRRDLDTPDQRASWVSQMLGPDPRDRHSKNRPFLWRATDSLTWSGQDPNTCGGGLFLGRMVLKVFAEHLSIVGSSTPGALEALGFVPSSKPRGALMLSIQAVNRALEYSLTGKTEIPQGNDKTGHFSKENWGDYERLTTLNGQDYRKPVKRATVFAATINALDDQRWAAIIDAGKSFIGKKDTSERRGRARVGAAPLLQVQESDDEVIQDSMYM